MLENGNKSNLVEVAIPSRLSKTLHYRIPDDLEGQIQVGSAVRVPLIHREVTAYVIGFPDESNITKIKGIHEILTETPVFDHKLLELFTWVSTYYHSPLGQVLKTFLPSLSRARLVPNRWFEVDKHQEEIQKGLTVLKKENPRQAELLLWIIGKGGTVDPNMIRDAGFSLTSLKALVRKGFLLPLDHPKKNDTDAPSGSAQKKFRNTANKPEGIFLQEIRKVPIPSKEQKEAIKVIHEGLGTKRFHSYLLEGVTGSGKTEVYIHAIQETLKLGKEVLFLVPEIALTTLLIERLRERLNEPVAILHSALSPGERWHAWGEIQNGVTRVALGVRSAVFAPFKRLGLIIIDEEQDASYKQGEGLRYHARDVALMRAKLCDALVILGSATPSLESLYNCRLKKYHHLHLTHRVDQRPLPKVHIIDLRDQEMKEGVLLSPPLLSAMEERLDRREQVLLFLNRRGFRPSLLCRLCGFNLRCPNCSVGLTLYKNGNALCHYCAYVQAPPDTCPDCQGSCWGEVGGGTEKLEDEVRSNFPKAKMLRMDRDTTRKKNTHGIILRSMAERQCDILIGTQMIAKGHDLPGITLVGIVFADVGLTLPDFRAAERLFQLITQVSGRCGRGTLPGEVLIQTLNPEEKTLLLAANHNPGDFYRDELLHRENLFFPPFCRLVLLGLQGNKKERVSKTIEQLGKMARSIKKKGETTWGKDIEILGPAPAPLEKIRGKYRYQILIKGRTIGGLKNFLNFLFRHTKGTQSFLGVELFVDSDPQTFL